MEKGASILIGQNVVDKGTFFIKDQKAVGTAEDSMLEQNVIFIDDEDIIDFFIGRLDEEEWGDAAIRAKVEELETQTPNIIYRNIRSDRS